MPETAAKTDVVEEWRSAGEAALRAEVGILQAAKAAGLEESHPEFYQQLLDMSAALLNERNASRAFVTATLMSAAQGWGSAARREALKLEKTKIVQRRQLLESKFETEGNTDARRVMMAELSILDSDMEEVDKQIERVEWTLARQEAGELR